MEDVVRVEGALSRFVAAEIARLTRERDEANRESKRLTDVLLSRHGGEPLSLLEELDEARRERDEAVMGVDLLSSTILVLQKWIGRLGCECESTSGFRCGPCRFVEIGDRALREAMGGEGGDQ